MSLTKQNQELLDDLYPDGYEIKTIDLKNGKIIDEHNYYHVLFVKIIPQKDQANNKLIPMIQKFGITDWAQMQDSIEKRGIGITQHNYFQVIHDPVKWKAAEEKKAKDAALKSKQDAKKEKVEASIKAAAKPKSKPGPKPAKVESQN